MFGSGAPLRHVRNNPKTSFARGSIIVVDFRRSPEDCAAAMHSWSDGPYPCENVGRQARTPLCYRPLVLGVGCNSCQQYDDRPKRFCKRFCLVGLLLPTFLLELCCACWLQSGRQAAGRNTKTSGGVHAGPDARWSSGRGVGDRLAMNTVTFNCVWCGRASCGARKNSGVEWHH